jgi:hypothetical protein
MARHLVQASSQYLINASAPLTAAPCTFACWVNPILSGGSAGGVQITDGTVNNAFGVEFFASGAVAAETYGSGVFPIAQTAAGSLTAGTWQHIAGVFASSTSRIAFANGVASSPETTAAIPTGLNQILIGNNSGHYGNGDIAEAAVWNVALSALEIATLAAGVSPLLVRPSALVFYAPLSGFGSPEPDIIGRRNLTLTNAPTAAAHPRLFALSNRSAWSNPVVTLLPVGDAAFVETATFSGTGLVVPATTGTGAVVDRADFLGAGAVLAPDLGTGNITARAGFVGAGVSIPPMARVIIAGVERRDLLIWSSLNIDQQLGSRKVCSFRIEDPDGLYYPEVGNPITIYNGFRKEFNGTIEEATRTGTTGTEGGVMLATAITCVSREQVFDRHLVSTIYTNQTLGQIVRDIVANNLADENISTAGVEEGPLIESAVFPYITVTEAFNDLKNLTTYSYWLDDDDVLHFQARSSVLAPFPLDDRTGATWPVRDFSVLQTRQDYRNRQFIRAGVALTSVRSESFVGDGVLKTFLLSYPVGAVPSFTVNGVGQTPGIRGVESGKDWYWNKNTNEISQDDAASAIPITATLVVTYQGLYPIIVTAQNDTEINDRKRVEGGSGVYESIEQDASINSNGLALDEAQGYLAQYGYIKDVVTYTTLTPGLAVGQIQAIQSEKFDVSSTDPHLIAAVNVQGLDEWPGFKYGVTLVSGEGVGGWVEFFQNLAAATHQFVIRENEVLLTLRSFPETVHISDYSSYAFASGQAIVDLSTAGFCEAG